MKIINFIAIIVVIWLIIFSASIVFGFFAHTVAGAFSIGWNIL